jgi:NTE family protein
VGPKPAAAREHVILLLQGGGALGAYQAGAYEELTANGILVDWVSGISIGAIDAAIIAGNPPEKRIEKLRGFWTAISGGVLGEIPLNSLFSHTLSNEMAALWITAAGVSGFFTPRIPPPFVDLSGKSPALSYYDTGPLRETLKAFVDFSRINSGDMHFSDRKLRLFRQC